MTWPSFDLCCFSVIEDRPVVKLLPLHDEKKRIIGCLCKMASAVDEEISMRMAFFESEFIDWIDAKLQNDREKALEVLRYTEDLMTRAKPDALKSLVVGQVQGQEIQDFFKTLFSNLIGKGVKLACLVHHSLSFVGTYNELFESTPKGAVLHCSSSEYHRKATVALLQTYLGRDRVPFNTITSIGEMGRVALLFGLLDRGTKSVLLLPDQRNTECKIFSFKLLHYTQVPTRQASAANYSTPYLPKFGICGVKTWPKLSRMMSKSPTYAEA